MNGSLPKAMHISQKAGGFSCQMLLIPLFLVVAFALCGVHDFLAVSSPAGKGILVVEAWIPVEALSEAIGAFKRGNYCYLVVVGNRNSASGISAEQLLSPVDQAAGELEKSGFDGSKVIRVYHDNSTDKTFSSARALKTWLLENPKVPRSIDVFTVGVHARRSWIAFEKALGDDFHVGIIAARAMYYNPGTWILSRKGIWLVTRNISGYLIYKSRFMFS
jgi:hypothetical protein